MAGEREAIATRALTVVQTELAADWSRFKRNDARLGALELPALVMLDGGDRRLDAQRDALSRPVTAGQAPPQLYVMSMQFLFAFDVSAEALGTEINARLDALIAALTGDQTLIDLLSVGSWPRYAGLEMHEETRLPLVSFEMTYVRRFA